MKWQNLGDQLPQAYNPLTRLIGRSTLRILGWRINGEFPNRPKFVVALVPHSSNMDFILTIAVLWSLGLKSSFMMKHTLFWFPLGPLLVPFWWLLPFKRNWPKWPLPATKTRQ